jgi:uncharacterized protein YbjT (DUF2867 family)
MYLLVGGTGLLGGRVAARMRERGLPVRALVRPTSDGSSLSTLGVDVVRGDMRDRASIDAALAGVDTVVTTANAMARNLAGDTTISIHEVDEVGNANLIEAAARAGVARFVFVSAEREELEAGTPFTRAKLATEAILATAPFRTVIIRPEAFQEVWLSPMVGVDLPHGTVRVFGKGKAHHPYVAVDDVAEAIVRLTLMDEPPGEAMIAGPEALSFDDIVVRWTEITGMPVKVSHVPRPMLAIGSTVLRPFKPALSSTMGMALQADGRDSTGSAETIRELGIEPRSVTAFLQGLAGVEVAPA